jgi:hypothetical protein
MKRKSQVGLASIFLILGFFINGSALAQQVQVLNPSFVKARDLWRELSASSLSPDEKAPYGRRFGSLAREQQSLWSLAGEVDRGQCKGQCVTAYNNRVIAWQSSLAAFNRDAHLALESTNLPRVGVWRIYGKFTQINVACRQMYVCVPAETIMHPPEMKIVSTPAQTVTGMCQADQSNPESCEHCTAERTPPTDRCEWHLERR